MSIRPLTPELAEIAHKRFHEDPEKMQAALQQIKDWLALQTHLNARTDEQWLAGFIRGSKFDLEKVKKTIDLFYTCRHTARQCYQLHHKDAKFKELIESGFYLPLPKLSHPAAPRVTLVRTGAFDLLEIGQTNALAAAHIIDKILLMDDDNSTIAGNVVIVDIKHTNPVHLLQLTPTQTKMFALVIIPFHTWITIVINVLEEHQLLVNFMRMGANKSMNEMYYTYTENYDEMFTKHDIPKEIMPIEYGGNGGTLKEIIDYWKEKVEKYSEWLEDDLQFGTDESKRSGQPKTTESMFGDSVVKSPFELLQLLLFTDK